MKMIPMSTSRYSLHLEVAAASTALALLASSHLAAGDEMSTILGCARAGPACNLATAVPGPGNVSVIQQNGSFGSASVEQQAILGAYANVTVVQQDGLSDSANVTQTGSQNGTSVAQHGDNETATVQQNGTNLNIQINQYGNGGVVGVTQTGSGGSIKINTYK